MGEKQGGGFQMSKKEIRHMAKEILQVPLGYEGSIYNWAVQAFKNVYGIYPQDVIKKKEVSSK